MAASHQPPAACCAARRCTGRSPSAGSTGPGSAGARRGVPVDERGEQRRVQPAQRRRRAVEAPGHREHVEAVGDHAGDERCRQLRRRSCVGVDEDHPLAGRCLQSLLQRPRLTRPPFWEPGSGHDRRAVSLGEGSGPVARLVVDDHDLGDPRRADDRIEQRPEPSLLVACRDDDADAVGVSGGERRPAARGAGDRGQRDASGGETDQSHVTRSATMRAPMATSGRPPPGWVEPPTRYRPRRAPRLPGRRNAARRPFDDVP